MLRLLEEALDDAPIRNIDVARRKHVKETMG